MKKSLKYLFFSFILLSAFLIIFSIYHCSFPTSAIVKEVIDGDTVQLENGLLLRYLGLNTPEIRDKNTGRWFDKVSFWGEEACLYNRKLVLNRRIRIEYDRKKKDKYQRLLGYVFIDNIFVNALLLEKGLAIIDVRKPNFKYNEVLARSFKLALENRDGIWGEIKILSPKDVSEFLGEIVVVKAPVLDTYEAKNIFLIFMPAGFRAVIFKDNLMLFNKEDLMKLRWKTLKVYGLVKKYKGHYEIIIHHPYQLEILQ